MWEYIVIAAIRLYYVSIAVMMHYYWLGEILWLAVHFTLYHSHLIFQVTSAFAYEHFQRNIQVWFRAYFPSVVRVQRMQNFRRLHSHFYAILWRREHRHIWHGKFGLRPWVKCDFIKVFNRTFIRILLAIWINNFCYLIQLPYHLCRIRRLIQILCHVVACRQPYTHPWAVSSFFLL